MTSSYALASLVYSRHQCSHRIPDPIDLAGTIFSFFVFSTKYGNFVIKSDQNIVESKIQIQKQNQIFGQLYKNFECSLIFYSVPSSISIVIFMQHDKELNESQSCFKRVTVCGAISIRIVPYQISNKRLNIGIFLLNCPLNTFIFIRLSFPSHNTLKIETHL